MIESELLARAERAVDLHYGKGTWEFLGDDIRTHWIETVRWHDLGDWCGGLMRRVMDRRGTW